MPITKKALHPWQWHDIESYLKSIEKKLNHLNKKALKIMATQDEAAAQLQEITTQLTKVGTETSTLLEKVAALEAAAAAAGNVTPQLQTAIDAVKAQAQAVDDEVPDALSKRHKKH